MIIQNFNFFDKFGKNLNLDLDSTGSFWKGVIYFPELSTYLYDNENIFILEKIGADYKFPALASGDSLIFEWEINTNSNEIFLYDVETDITLNNLFINKKESTTITYSDVNVFPNNSNVDVSLPLQINVAFNPSEEVNYTRTLILSTENDSNPGVKTKIAEIGFYGEGLNEDQRFGVWARNFGIKFNKEDANILKEYDVKEAFPDWEQLNTARKNLLVNKEHVFPYIGTYKGLNNFVNLLGYKDVLHIKEYWKNINKKSPYYEKQSLVDITDYLDDGKIDNMNILDQNRNIKFGKQFRKTECLALVYQFTQESGVYDDDGIPIVEETTDFTVDEIFYKLNKLKDKLKEEILPVNVKIKDIIGEFIYFQKITIKFWSDRTPITDVRLNDKAEVLCYPDKNVNLILRSLAPLYRQRNLLGIDFADVILNKRDNTPWVFYDNYFKFGRFGMISKNKHNLKVGDIVYIEQDPGFTNASYNGEHIIQDIISDFIVITDQAWALNTGAEGGSVIRSNPKHLGTKDPFESDQKYIAADIPDIISYIEDFYNNIKNQRFPDLGARLTWEDGDDPERVIGAPIVLDVDAGKFTFDSFKGVTFADVAGMGANNPYFKLENIDFRNYGEITWKISKTGTNPYNFEYRGKMIDIHKLPHFLPYAGTYRITAELHDFYGTTSVFSKFITVDDDIKPDIVGVARLEDKFDYRLSNLDNIRLIDFGPTYNYYPKTTVLDNEDAIVRIDMYKQLLEWYRYYQNNYGGGKNIYDAALFDTTTNAYVDYRDTNQRHPKLSYWGLGGGNIPTAIKDMSDITLDSLYYQRLCNMVYTNDFLAGFYMWDPIVGDEISISSYSPYTIPSFATLQDLVDDLNASTHKGIKKYNYELLDTKVDGTALVPGGDYTIGTDTTFAYPSPSISNRNFEFVDGGNGFAYSAPGRSGVILKLDLSDDTLTTFGSFPTSGIPQFKYGIKSPTTNKIYFFPDKDAGSIADVLVIDPLNSDAITSFSWPYATGITDPCITPSGIIYANTTGNNEFYKIDTNTENVSVLTTVSTFGGGHAIYSQNDFVYILPDGGNGKVYKINPVNDSFLEILTPSLDFTLDGAVETSNGIIYGLRTGIGISLFVGKQFFKLDTSNDTSNSFITSSPSNNQINEIVILPDDSIYVIHYNTRVLKLDTLTDTTSVVLNLPGTGAYLESNFIGGDIYSIAPNGNQPVLKIGFSQVLVPQTVKIDKTVIHAQAEYFSKEMYHTLSINPPANINLRLPTDAEWQNEANTWSPGGIVSAFSSILKLPATGYRNSINGSLSNAGIDGGYWSSTVSSTYSLFLYFNSSSAFMSLYYRANGLSVRLIVDGTFTPTEYNDNYSSKTIVYLGLTYGFVYNTTTQKIWLDRNLGATQVATSFNDAASYGDLYQWGRSADGHQLRTSLNYDGDTSPKPSTASETGAWDSKFITVNSTPFDWLSIQDNSLGGSVISIIQTPTQIDEYTFHSLENTYSPRTIDHLKNRSANFNSEMLFMFAKTSDMLNGNVDLSSFWKTNKYMEINSDIQKGFIPTVFDQNSFNTGDIKIYDSSFTIPENCPVFFNVNNLDGKKDFVWTLTDVDTDEEIIKVTNVPFFAWKFKDIGVFRLKADVTDNRGTTYSNEMDRLITVLNKTNYVKGIETRLNRRKNQLLNKIN